MSFDAQGIPGLPDLTHPQELQKKGTGNREQGTGNKKL
jgi:hypothetical protein